MTCIVGTRSRKGVILGGDSLASSGLEREVRKDPKVGIVGEYVFGYSGSYRMGQVLLYDFDPPEPDRKTGPEVFEFLVTEFIPTLREAMSGAGVTKLDSSVEELGGANFLLGVYGHLFYVDDDYQVGWPSTPYWSIGSGREYATGAMYTAYKAKKRGEDLLSVGLTAAEAFNSGVGGPFTYESNY